MPLAAVFRLSIAAHAAHSAVSERPPIDGPAALRAAEHSVVVDVPFASFVDWFLDVPLERHLKGTDGVPAVVGTELLTPAWGPVGSRRRVLISDGSTALEEIVENRMPEGFRYQVWDYTSPAARFVSYGVGEFTFSPTEDGTTQVNWSYAFRPRGVLGQLFLGGWVRRVWSPWMVDTLAVIMADAESSPALRR